MRILRKIRRWAESGCVEAYIPPDTNDITCTQSDRSILEWKIVYDATVTAPV